MKKIILLMFSIFVIVNVYSKEYNLQDVASLWQIDVYKAEETPETGYYKTDFLCIKIGAYSYVFIEKNLPVDKIPDTAFIDKLFNFFEKIYPKLTDYFGPPSDMDNNNKFIIAMADIRDWFTYQKNIPQGAQPIQGYYSYELNLKDNKDFLTMDIKQPIIDAYGTLVNQYFKNIYENANPKAQNPKDRAIAEALAHFAVYLAGTIDKDSYIQWQFSQLEKDLITGKLLNPFDGTHNYFDIKNPDTHHCYAAGYLFMYYVTNYILDNKYDRKEFLYALIYEKTNQSAYKKLISALIKTGVLKQSQDFGRLYNEEFKNFLYSYFNIKDFKY